MDYYGSKAGVTLAKANEAPTDYFETPHTTKRTTIFDQIAGGLDTLATLLGDIDSNCYETRMRLLGPWPQSAEAVPQPPEPSSQAERVLRRISFLIEHAGNIRDNARVLNSEL